MQVRFIPSSLVFFALLTLSLSLLPSDASAQKTRYERGDKVLLPAPVGVSDVRLGMGYPKDLSRLDERRVIDNEVQRVSESSYRAVFRKQTDTFELNASATALGIQLASGRQSQESRHAVLQVYNVSEVASLTASPAQAQGSNADLFVSKIYYGWALNVAIQGTSTSFTAGVAAQIQQMAGAGGSIETMMKEHDLRSEVTLRGLESKSTTPPIALTWQAVQQQFDIGEPQPILVEYTFLRDVEVDPIEWKERTVKAGRYRITEIAARVSENKRGGSRWDIMSGPDVKIEMSVDRNSPITIGFSRNLTRVSTSPDKMIELGPQSVLRFEAYDDDSTYEQRDPIGTASVTFEELKRAAPGEPIELRTRGELTSLTITLRPVQ